MIIGKAAAEPASFGADLARVLRISPAAVYRDPGGR
jgi:hypothetical protein